jgi:ribonuclease Y
MAADQQIKFAEEGVVKKIQQAKKQADDILSKADFDAKEIILKSRRIIEEEIKENKRSLDQIENRLMQKEKYLTDRENILGEKDNQLNQELDKIKVIKKKEEALISELIDSVQKVAEITKEEAKEILLKTIERETRGQAGTLIKQIEEQAKKIANRKAKEIIATAIQRTTIDHISPMTTSIIMLSDDEMKGRVIGREGRNIRAFEAITGVDVIIDDTPNAVIISAFDPIRREIAKISLERLIEDGRIHPARIEEIVSKTQKDIDEVIREHGQQAADQVGVSVHPKLIEYLGKLYYRTSYGQNVLQHSLEVAYLAANMAGEIGVNETLAKRSGLLHDIGKAIDFEQEGSHAKLGEEVCRKYGESEEVLNCILAHHEDVPCDTIEAVLIMVADGISAARPGARKESLENYIKRLKALEDIALSFPGVEKTYAIQAGREIRVLVKPDEVDDPSSYKLALDIAKKIESEVDYPGEVRVSIIRETRATGIAR